MKKQLPFIVSLLVLFCTLSAQAKIPLKQYFNRPKLVLILVIDQFRSDYLTRYHSQFLPANKNGTLGGFRYLTENGAWFPQASFEVLQNMTGPGHATLLTGAYPYLTGIPINEWYDSKKQKAVYCVADTDSYSPKNLIGTTLGDELKNAYKESKVVSISLKDRSAVLMGGKRADTALWMDPAKLQWTTSSYYGDLPEWVSQENVKLFEKRNQLIASNGNLTGLFPKGIQWGDKRVLNTPAGVSLMEEFSEKAIEQYKLGSGGMDILALSFSSHDYAGHTYGPHGMIMEEMTLSEDKTLSKLFNYLNKKVPGGMKEVLVVLTADHGVAPNPELSVLSKIDASRIDEDKLKITLNKALTKKFGTIEKDWVLYVKEMNIFLNPAGLEKQNRIELEEFTKTEVLKIDGIAHVFSLTDYQNRKLPPGMHEKQILNSYFPGRSGDVVAILKPYSVSGDETATHQTGYAYDKTVPIVFTGKNILHGVYPQNIQTTDIAPTLASILGIIPPSQSEGRVLSEIIGN
jgi:predicted AlkP superfamily pyrophosphatase or phosphodiesterase